MCDSRTKTQTPTLTHRRHRHRRHRHPHSHTEDTDTDIIGTCVFGVCDFGVGVGVCVFVRIARPHPLCVCVCIYVHMRACVRARVHLRVRVYTCRSFTHSVTLKKKHIVLGFHTGWRRLTGCCKLKVIFCKRATNSRALLRKMTCKDKASYDSTPPCTLM